MKKLISQILRFGMVGFLCTAIDFAIMIFLTDVIGIKYIVSSGISFTISVIVNYILSTLWVFDSDQEKNKIIELMIFIIMSVIGLGLNLLIMYVSVDLVNWNYKLAKIGATAVVMVYNFVTRKLFIEKKN